MKTPIEPSDIRKGDLIRWERGEESSSFSTAVEFVASHDGDKYDVFGQHYLLSRPTPPVTLPDTPTLGWAGFDDQAACLAVWKPRGGHVDVTCMHGSPTGGTWEGLTAFTPATAVPTDALDELRAYRQGLDVTLLTPALRRIDKFLAAVDAAGEGK